MAPTLFNLYASVVTEKWTEAVQGTEEAGIELHYMLDQQLFRRSTRGTSKGRELKGEFADDLVLVASSREAAEAAGRAYVDVTKALGLTVNLSIMVVGHGVTEEDKLPLPLEDTGAVEWVGFCGCTGWLITHRVGQENSKCIQSLWGIETSCLQGQTPDSSHQETHIQCLRALSAAVRQ